MLVGSMGMLPSASLGTRQTGHGVFGLYEPIHGTAPEITGQGIANPLAAISAWRMLLRHSLSLATEAETVEQAVEAVIAAGYRTPDIATAQETPVSTPVMGAEVARRVALAGAPAE